MEKEYNVILKKGVDYDQFGNDMITITNKDGIPNREIEIANARLGSYRQTHYNLTDEEAAEVRNHPDVLDVEIPPEKRDDVVIGHNGRQSGTFTKSPGTTQEHVNYALLRSKYKNNIYGTGTELSEDYLFNLDGTGVDIVVSDSGIEANHPEWEDANGVSRLQSIKIEPTDEQSLSIFLQDKYNIEKDRADETAKLSEGNIGKSIHFLVGNDLLQQNTQEFQNWMRMCYKAKIVDLASWVDVANSWGREQQKGFLQYALHMIRESLIQNFGHHNIKKVRQEEAIFTEKFAPFIHQNNAIEIIEELECAYQHIARNGSAKIIFMDLTLKMVVLLHVKSINLQTTTN